MMFEWLGKKHGDAVSARAAEKIRNSVKLVLQEGRVRTPDLCVGEWSSIVPSTTQQVTDEIIRKMKR